MATGAHFGCPKFTFDRISGHFRSIRNFIFLEIFANFFFWIFWTKWPPAAILDVTTMSIIELVRDIWMGNALVKFEEHRFNPSKVIALTTKLWCGGGVADENKIFPETCVSREYNNDSDHDDNVECSICRGSVFTIFICKYLGYMLILVVNSNYLE